jgi:hypothetical protein
MSKPKNLLSELLEKSPIFCFFIGAIFVFYFAYAVYGKDEIIRSIAVLASSIFSFLLAILIFARPPNSNADEAINARQKSLEQDVADAIANARKS